MGIGLGCFGNLEDIPAIAEAGFEQAELDVQDVMELDPDAYLNLKIQIQKLGIHCDAFNTMVPVSVSDAFYEPTFDFDYWVEFQLKAAKATAELGAKYWIFAQGDNRALPKTGDIIFCKERIKEFIRHICAAANQFGIMVLIEPLSPLYSNYLMTLEETAGFLSEMEIDNLSAMADIRHMVAQNEPLTELAKYASIIKHVHIDNPITLERYFPKATDPFNYNLLFGILKAMNYKGIISAEGRYFMKGEAHKQFSQQAKQARIFLRSFV